MKKIPLFFGDKKVHEWVLKDKEEFETKILLCPNCLRQATFHRYHGNNKWKKTDFEFSSFPLKINSEIEYFNHMNNCGCILKNSINKIDKTSDKHSFIIADQLSNWCGKETGFDGQQVREQDFDNGLITYIFKNETGPISIAAFWKRSILISETEEIEPTILWDLFTFSEFRNKGIAKKLVYHGIEDLNIDESILPVSVKVTDSSCSLLQEISTDKILAVFSTLVGIRIDKKNLSNLIFRKFV